MRPIANPLKALVAGLILALAASGAQAQTLSVNASSDIERNGTGVNALFSVSMTRAGGTGAFTFDWTVTTDGTATAGDVIASGTGVNFPAFGPATQLIAIPCVNRDNTREPNETFTLTINVTSGGSTGTAAATMTITNDDLPKLSIANVSHPEQTANVILTVSMDKPSDTDVAVDFATATPVVTNPATGGGTDYTTTSGTVTYTAGQFGDKTFSVPVTNDTSAEFNEQFTVGLSNVVCTPSCGSDVSISPVGNAGVATVTIVDNDAPILLISTATANEYAGTLDFTVTRSAPTPEDITFYVFTTDGTATSGPGNDFTGISSLTPMLVSFPAASPSVVVSVGLLQDVSDEIPFEAMTLSISDVGPYLPTNAQRCTSGLPAKCNFTGNIYDDDPGPIIAITSPAPQTEPAVNTPIQLTVTRTCAPLDDVCLNQVVTFTWKTTAGTAASNVDYTAVAAGNGTIPSGAPSTTVNVTLRSDTLEELQEAFTVQLLTVSSPSANATIGGSPATVTINPDTDSSPVTLSINDITDGESTGNTNFTVTRTGGTGLDTTFTCTVSGTGTHPATLNTDFTAVICDGSSLNTIPASAGNATKTITLSVANDTRDEWNETLSVTITPFSANATINACGVEPCMGGAVGNGTITDNDNPPTVSIANQGFPESGGGPALVVINLSAPSDFQVTVEAATSAGTATAGGTYGDYTQTPPTGVQTVIIPANSSSATFSVPYTDDARDEANETFLVNLTNARTDSVGPCGTPPCLVPITITGTGTGTMTITNDDAANAPTVSIAADVAAVTEGNVAGFTITLSGESGRTVTVRASTNGGTATAANGDYINPNISPSYALITFLEGETIKTHTVQTLDDPNDEAGNENFTVNLSNPVNTSIVTGTAVQDIFDNDDATTLGLNIDNVTVADTDGNTTATFTITMTGTSYQPVTFTATTADNGATAPADYTPKTQPRTIAAGSTSTTFVVTIIGDASPEGNETFNVNLTPGNGNATIDDGIGLGTIVDTPVTTGLMISEFRLRGADGPEDEFIEIKNKTGSPLLVVSPPPSTGYAVVSSAGTTLFTIPNGTTIEVGGHYLGVNSNGYSLDNYGGVNKATANASWTGDVADTDAGIGLFNRTDFIDGSTLMDAVGFGAAPPNFFENASLPNAYTGADGQYSHIRRLTPSGTGDTNNNANDFQFVQTKIAPGALVAPIPSGPVPVLGSPGPENMSSPVVKNGLITPSRLDTGVLDTAVPNTEYTAGPFVYLSRNYPNGVLSLRRTMTNNTGASVTKLRFRVVEITTENMPDITAPHGPPQADLRFVSSTAEPSVPISVAPGTASTMAVTLDTGVSLGLSGEGGGLNTTGTITLVGPLPDGASVNVHFRLAVESGGKFRFLINLEALPQ